MSSVRQLMNLAESLFSSLYIVQDAYPLLGGAARCYTVTKLQGVCLTIIPIAK